MPRLFALRQSQPVMQQSCGCARNQSRECAVPGRAFPECAEQQHCKQRSIHNGEDQQHRIEHAVEAHGGARSPERKQHAA